MVLQTLVTAGTVSNVQMSNSGHIDQHRRTRCTKLRHLSYFLAFPIIPAFCLPQMPGFLMLRCPCEGPCVMTLCHLYTCPTLRAITVRSQT